MKKSFLFALLAIFFVGCEPPIPDDPTPDDPIIDNPTPDDPSDDPSDDDSTTPVIKSIFSVSGTQTVTFAPGNLQYTQSTNTWSFASAQYEQIGTDNVVGGSHLTDPSAGSFRYGKDLADKVDMFGWSTSATNFGVSTSKSNQDYAGDFVDWGTNKIGEDDPNTWRTPTLAEWEYIIKTRPNAKELQAAAQVNGVSGLILLPDAWVCPADITFKPGFREYSSMAEFAEHQSFTAEQWAVLEQAGAVFLPASGFREGPKMYNVDYFGRYWASTAPVESLDVDFLGFYSNDVYVSNCSCLGGQCVRLIKDL